ncbi:hypothetical protein IH979_00315 [Patescibacteria group bacterium]|nr:hypothetical protein [Patescibacteria group bacterium]
MKYAIGLIVLVIFLLGLITLGSMFYVFSKIDQPSVFAEPEIVAEIEKSQEIELPVTEKYHALPKSP